MNSSQTLLKGKSLLSDIDSILSQSILSLDNKEIVLRRCFTENWFSDTLAWLLNPKGSHGLGVNFAKEFLKCIAKNRSNNEDLKSRTNMLKWGKTGVGTSSLHFSLKNASSIREFYLAQSVEKRNSRGARYCDVVFLDLDVSDGLFVVIENKLFTSNRRGQLEEYYQLTEEKFKRTKVREYVYLNLYGEAPLDHGDDSTALKYWVPMSWSKDILGILKKLGVESGHSDLVQISSILEWLNNLKSLSIGKVVGDIRNLLLEATSLCLLEELNRLGENNRGTWEIGKTNSNHVKLVHSSSKKKPLYVELLPNFTITVQSRRKDSPLFEKIIVPFGVNTDQVFNLMDIAARDIYYFHFGDNVQLYLSNKRRLSATTSKQKQELKYIFDYVFKKQYELKIILSSSRYVLEAQKWDVISFSD